MTFLVETARSWVEMFLGWAMLVPYSQTCRGAVTESTWSELEGLLRERGRLRQAFVRHVGRYYGQLVGGIRHLANVPPETVCPVVARQNGGFPRAEPLRRVRIQHATVWAAPVGLPQLWRDWRDAFLTRGYDPLVTRFERDPPQACAGWRQVTRRQLTEDVCVEVTTSTLRFLLHGFHVELVEQTVIFLEESETGSEETSAGSPSSGRRMRRQHVGLEHT